MKRQIDTPARDEDLFVVKSRLYWQLMGDRRKAISAVDSCIRGLHGLRQKLGQAAVDPLVRDYKSVRRFLDAIRADAMPSEDQVVDYHRQMNDLQRRLSDLNEALVCNRQSLYIPVVCESRAAPQPLPVIEEK